MRWRSLPRLGVPVALTIFLATIITATTASQPVSAGFYRRSAAVAYADQWSSNTGVPRNSAYPNFGNDCTNFVSQVLYAGGYPPRGSRDDACFPDEWWKPTNFLGLWRWPHSWSVAECMRQYMTAHSPDFQLWASSNIVNLQGGDVIMISEDMSANPTHSRVAIGPGYDAVDGLWEQQLISQHTTDRKRRYWYIALDSAWPLWAWHVNW